MGTTGISNRVLDPKARKPLAERVRADVDGRRREQEQVKLDQISTAWVLRERLTKRFAINSWGVTA